MVEDPHQPQSWLRDLPIHAWDLEKKAWSHLADALSNAPPHTHRFKAPVKTTRLRLTLHAGVNPRLTELVLLGEVAGDLPDATKPGPSGPPKAPNTNPRDLLQKK